MRPLGDVVGICLSYLVLVNVSVAQGKVVRKISINVPADTAQTIACRRNEFIRIAVATWFGPQCPSRVDRRPQVGKLCDNKTTCKFAPHWAQSDRLRLNLGEVCQGKPKRLEGMAECHDPCVDMDCGNGLCQPLTATEHECKCSPGNINVGVDRSSPLLRSARCVPDQCRVVSCGRGGVCHYDGTEPSYWCHCKPGYRKVWGVCREIKHRRSFHVEAGENVFRAVECPAGQLLHVKAFVWGGFSMKCSNRRSRKRVMRLLCEDKRVCRFVPHRTRSDLNFISLGSYCTDGEEKLIGTMQCWDACAGEDCGEGSCVPVRWNSYRCDCNPGSVNAGGTTNGKCVSSICSGNPCGVGKCALAGRNAKFTCICPNGYKFMENTCKAYDTCSDEPPRCPSGALCTDGVGKAPTCKCPDYHELKAQRCVVVDMCEGGNGGCPPNARCTDGVGRQPTCLCQEYFTLRDGGCEPVDQCLINNGGCDSIARCDDGVGKEATCTCPGEFYELEQGKCVDIDECLFDNGGCGEYATCKNNIGGDPSCICKHGFNSDGRSCRRPGGPPSASFVFPDNGSIKVVAFDIAGHATFSMGECLKVYVDPMSGSVRAVHREQQATGNFEEKDFESAHLLFLVHRQNQQMQTYVFRRDAKDKGAQWKSLLLPMRWDETCRINRVELDAPSTSIMEPTFFRTTNIKADAFIGPEIQPPRDEKGPREEEGEPREGEREPREEWEPRKEEWEPRKEEKWGKAWGGGDMMPLEGEGDRMKEREVPRSPAVGRRTREPSTSPGLRREPFVRVRRVKNEFGGGMMPLTVAGR